jgi:hypothetical protein
VLITVVETAVYIAKAEKIMTQFEIESVVTLISENPSVGDLIKGTGGLRKTRIGLEGRGKRSGGRVIYWHHNEGVSALLLWAFAKK